MAGRSFRMAFLALATWAVLFAPGAAAGEAGAGEPVSSGQVAAAVMAPTFGSGEVIVARSCRDDMVVRHGCASAAGDVPRDPTPPLQHHGSSLDREDEGGGSNGRIQQSAPTRAPPSD